MAVFIRELKGGSLTTDQDSEELRRPFYAISDDETTNNDDAVRAEVPNVTPYQIGTKLRDSIDVRHHKGRYWHVDVIWRTPALGQGQYDYTPPAPTWDRQAQVIGDPSGFATNPAGGTGPGQQPQPSTPGDDDDMGPEYSFTTQGGTRRLTQSFNTIARRQIKYDESGVKSNVDPAADYKRAIGRRKDGSVEGVDVVDAALRLTTTRWVRMTKKYLRTLCSLTGRVNDRVFWGYRKRALLFLGAHGQYDKKKQMFKITYDFDAKPHLEGDELNPSADLAFPTGTVAEGHDYVWVQYEPTGIATLKAASVPTYAAIEQVYREADFRKLGLGV